MSNGDTTPKKKTRPRSPHGPLRDELDELEDRQKAEAVAADATPVKKTPSKTTSFKIRIGPDDPVSIALQDRKERPSHLLEQALKTSAKKFAAGGGAAREHGGGKALNCRLLPDSMATLRELADERGWSRSATAYALLHLHLLDQ